MAAKPRKDLVPEPPAETLLAIIRNLNEVLETDYQEATILKRTTDIGWLARKRLAEGFTLADFDLVARFKKWEWTKKPEMLPYLRASTLWADKHFDDYLQTAKIHLKHHGQIQTQAQEKKLPERVQGNLSSAAQYLNRKKQVPNG